MQYTKYASTLLLSCAIFSLQGMNEQPDLPPRNNEMPSYDPYRHQVYFKKIKNLAYCKVENKLSEFETSAEASTYYKEELDRFREINPLNPSENEEENRQEKSLIEEYFQKEKENPPLFKLRRKLPPPSWELPPPGFEESNNMIDSNDN